MMLGDGDDVLRTGFFKDPSPLGGIEVFGFEERDQILVTLNRIAAVARTEVAVGALAGTVHVAGIPLVLGGRNRVDAPMNEDAELGILVPLRLFVLDQGGPIGAEGAVVGLL